MERGGTRLNFHTFGLFGNLYSQRRAPEKKAIQISSPPYLLSYVKSVHLYKANVPWFLAVCKVSFFRQIQLDA